MGKVSIIIPVYNTGHYLYKCVDSVLNQTYKDIEVIIIDDGSCEETALICDEIARKDSRIRLIHKQNEGVSITRNAGLSLVTGEYVGFVDSDDWIDVDMFENLIREIEEHNADVAMCDVTTVWDSGMTDKDTFVCLPESSTLLKSEITPQRQLELAGSSCRALYRVRQLKAENIIFPEGIKFSEDRIFNMITLGTAKKFRYIKKSFYNRYMREGSCVNTFHEDFVEVTLKVNDIMKSVLRKHWDESYIPVFEQRNLRDIGNYAINIFLVNTMSLQLKWQKVVQLCNNRMLHVILTEQTNLSVIMTHVANRNISILFLLSLWERAKNIIRTLSKMMRKIS